MFRTRKYVLLFLLTIIISVGRLYGQKITYTVHRAGKAIGEVTTSLSESEHTKTYEIISDVNFKVLWKRYNRRTSNLVVYEKEAVKTSFLGIYMNNDLEDSSSINLAQNKYNCYRYPDDRFALNSNTELLFTTAKLYFHEPVGIQRIYSERFLQYCSIEPKGNHKYKLNLPNGRVNYYTYGDDKLVEILVDRTWFNLEIRQK